MSHIELYRMIEANSIEKLTAIVNHALSEGWELHGPTQVIRYDYPTEYRRTEGPDVCFYQADVCFYQAIVKLKPKDPSLP